MKNRVRYTVEEVLKNTFYQLPKFLFEDEFKKVSNDSRILYALIKDRHELSIKNKWYNDKGEVYLIMTREQMCDLLGVSLKPVIKAVNELIKHGLLEEERRGQGKPNLLYLLECKNFTLRNEPKNRDVESTGQDMPNTICRDVNLTGQNMENCQPINTNVNQTNFSKTDSINQTAADNQYNSNTIRLNDPISVKKEIANKIELERLLDTYPQYVEEIKEIYGIIADTLTSSKKSFRIAKKEMPALTVKEAFAQIGYDLFLYALQGLTANNSKVKNIKAYILTTLYNTTKAYVTHNITNENQEIRSGSMNHYPDNRIQYKTFDLDHFVKLAVARSMGT